MKKTVQTLKEHILETHSPRAVNGYLRMINQYLKYKTEKEAENATYSEIVQYIGVLRKTSLHPKTIMNHLFCIKMYYQWLVDIGQRNDHPCRDFYLKDKINKAIVIESLYTKQQLDELLKTHKAKLPLIRNRDKIILSLLVSQAITVFEIIHLRVSDLDLKNGTIHLSGSPKTMERILPLKAEQIMLFNNYLTRTRPLLLKNNKQPSIEDRKTLIPSIRGNQMKPISISSMFKDPMANGHKITPQKIRQSVIIDLLKSGADLRVIQAFTGHKRVSSIEEYRQTGLEELKSAVERLHPLQ
jgi:integrase/recombinase XerD